MSNYDFFAPATATAVNQAAAAPTPSLPAVSLPLATGGFWRRRWPLVVGGVAVVAVIAAVALLLTSGSSKPGRPDPGTARLFGEQTRGQLPAPVTADECLNAMRAFPAIANDEQASAAFLAGCEG